MEKSLITYREFGEEDAPSIKVIFNDVPFEGKDEVLKYLKEGRVTLPSFRTGVDAFTGETVLPCYHLMTDDEYFWNNMFIYYVETYNAKPEQAFIEKAVKSVRNRKK